MDKEREALVERLRSLKVLLGTDSPEVRGWAPAVQQQAQRILNSTIAALTAQQPQESDTGSVRVPNDKQDAERWRALLGCKRIRVLGYAGFNGDQGDYRHIGIELWTRHQAETKGNARELLTEFADTALLAAAKEPRK